MKKILLLLLCCALMLSTIACSQTQPETTEASADTTTEATTPVEETTEATEPEETTEVTEPEETEPVETTEQDLMSLVKPQGKPLSEEDMILFQDMLSYPDGDRVYNIVTTFLFDSPQDVDLDTLLRAIPGQERKLTEAEENFLKYTRLCKMMPSYVKKYGGGYTEIGIYKVSDVDGVLQQYFGITLEEYDKQGLTSVYWDSTDCYYRTMGDMLTGMPVIEAVYCRGDVYYDIYYTSDPNNGYLYNTIGSVFEPSRRMTLEEQENVLCFCLTLKETESGYQIVSNTRLHRPAEPKEEVWTPQ